MKTKRSILYLVVLTLGLSCSIPQDNSTSQVIKETPNRAEEMQNDTLILSATATYKLEIGYGTIFDLDVNTIIEGDLKDKQLSLVIIESKYSSLLVESPNKHFTFHFIKEEENFQENRMFESGVVDMNKTAWKLTRIE